MSTIRPFDSRGWFPINNAVFDVIMKRLSPNAFKILMVTIRHTWGWKIQENKRKESDIITYRQFQEMSGIGSFQTVHDAIMECLMKGMLLRVQMPGTQRGNQKAQFAYSLNIEYEVETTTESVVGATTESVVGATTESVVGATTESVASKERNKQTKEVDVDSLNQITITAMTNFGVDPMMAKNLAQSCTLEMVQGWIAYCNAHKKIQDPPAFLVSRLRKGEFAPEMKKGKTKKELIEEQNERLRESKWAYVLDQAAS